MSLQSEESYCLHFIYRIGARGYFFYLLFQCFINGTPVILTVFFFFKPLTMSQWSWMVLMIRNTVTSHSSLAVLGHTYPFPLIHSWLTLVHKHICCFWIPGEWTGYLSEVEILHFFLCSAERKKTQVCSPEEYQKVFERLKYLPVNVEHLVVVLGANFLQHWARDWLTSSLGVPIAYPRLVFLEAALESKYNPLLYMAKAGTMGLGGFINKFNAEAELLDDLVSVSTS